MLSEADFRSCQRLMVQFLEGSPTQKLAIHADMGLGKTGAVLYWLSLLFDRFLIDTVLIVAPLQVARYTWPHELALWSFTRHVSYEVLWKAEPGTAVARPNGLKRLRYWEQKIERLTLTYTAAQANAATGLETPKEMAQREGLKRELSNARRTLKWGRAVAARPADIHIINRDNVVWLVHFWGKFWPYDTVVYDESSDLKNAQRVLRWRAMRRVMGQTQRFIELTGTPAPKGLIDLWGQFYVLDGGARLGRSITEYRKRYFTVDYSGFVYEPRPEAMARVTQGISDICISLRAEDFLDLPPTLYTAIPVTLDEREMDTYRELEAKYIVELEDGGEIQAVTNAVLNTKLLQLANGLVYDGDKLVHTFHQRKIEALKDYIAERLGQRVLVAYYFKHDLAALRQAFPLAPVFGQDEGLIERWNAGDIPLMLIHPGSAGHGINIQFGGRRILWYGPIPTQDLELYQQLNARLAGARAVGQGTTFIDTLTAIGTVDERVIEVLSMKGITQNLIRNATRVTQSTKN